MAFSFCAADVLLELDSSHAVTYAGGATVALTGRPPEALAGASIFDLIPEYDNALLHTLLERARAGIRVERRGIRLLGPQGPSFPVTLVGYYLPDLGGRYFLALRMGAGMSAAPQDETVGRDRESGLMNVESFAAASQARLSEMRARGEDCRMTVFDLENLKDLRARLDAESRGRLMSTLGDFLRANSVDGDSAARFGEDRCGLFHAAGLDVVGLRRRIADYALEMDPEGTGISVKTATVDIDPGDIDPDDVGHKDATKALIYMIKRFDNHDGDGLTADQLSAGLASEMKDTVQRISSVRSIITAGAFDVAFQPILDLKTRRIHHFEALVRLRDGDAMASPLNFVQFAEEVGVVADFDLAMCRRVIEWLGRMREARKDHSVAVNLSGRSLGSMEFVAKLISLLKDNAWIGDRLLFELTESAKITDLARTNKIIRALRNLGHKMCLDDFGAGESAFHYLRALDVDMVKIDGSYVRDALAVTRDKHFLKSIAGLCNDLGVATVAEMIEDEETVGLLRKCGVTYGQGFLFGRPSLDITTFDASRSVGRTAAMRERPGI